MEDETCICPFNMSHQVTKKRIHYHLVKCQKNHPDVQLVACPFNATHLIKGSEISNHIDACPSRPIEIVERGIEQLMFTRNVREMGKDTELDKDAKRNMETHENEPGSPQQERIPRVPKTCPRALSVCGLSIRIQR